MDQSPRFSQKANMMIDDFGPDFGYFNFFVFEATMNFRFLGSHTELDLGTHHRGGRFGVWRFDAVNNSNFAGVEVRYSNRDFMILKSNNSSF